MSKHLQSIIDYQQQKNNSGGVMQSRTWYKKAFQKKLKGFLF